MPRLSRPGLPLTEAGVDGLDDVLEGQPLDEVLLGGVTALGVDHPVSGEVLDALARDPVQSLRRLHHGEGVVERLEVARQGAGVGTVAEPGSQALRFGGREAVVADVGRQVEDRRRTQSPVEVVVQQHLRGRDRLLRRHDSSSRPTESGLKAGRQMATYSAPSGPHE